jgi:hypothetical protein
VVHIRQSDIFLWLPRPRKARHGKCKNLLPAENAKCSFRITVLSVSASPSTPVTQKKGVLSPSPTEVGIGRIHSRRPRGSRAARRNLTTSSSLEIGTTRVVWSIERGMVVGGCWRDGNFGFGWVPFSKATIHEAVGGRSNSEIIRADTFLSGDSASFV